MSEGIRSTLAPVQKSRKKTGIREIGAIVVTGNMQSELMDRPIFVDKDKPPILLSDLQPHDISRENFQRCLKLYKYHVRDVYQEVEKMRFVDIPRRLKSRSPLYLTKEEVMQLDRWMQKRGRRLDISAHRHTENRIRDIDEATIQAKTTKAFQQYSEKDPFPATDILIELEGIEFSRACLLLSVAFPDNMPYFSEQLRQWVYPIQPDIEEQSKEYRAECFSRVNAIKSRIGVKAVDVEKVAFVLDCEKAVSSFRSLDISKPSGEPFAEGTFAFVYRTDGLPSQEQKCQVAIKHIFKSPTIIRHRMFAEISDAALLAVKSPEYFVKFFGWNEDGTSFLLAMEFVEFKDLETNLSELGTNWTKQDTRSTAEQIFQGLKIMHGAGMTHRDLKPENILLTSNTPGKIRIKIADFGISKRTSDRGTTFLRTNAGTYQYRAPEVARRWKDELVSESSTFSYTEKVDLWSAGCIIFEMASKEKLFPTEPPQNWGLEDTETLHRRLDGVDIESDGIQLAKRLLEFKAQDRPSAEQALESNWFAGLRDEADGTT
ncbi:kinase-like protein [Hypoxylon sp. EC38]|nr:kinase-like protein [Hypoxylon sp. EC38]